MQAFKVLRLEPRIQVASAELPAGAQRMLDQAMKGMAMPDLAVMGAAAAIDHMLKDKGLVEGSLYKRIEQAAADGLITTGMKAWAHHVRLEANDQRHADVDAGPVTREQAEAVVDFARMLGEFLYVLPARVTRGQERAKQAEEKPPQAG